EIYQKRNEFIKEFHPIFTKYHQQITGNSETVKIKYESQLHNKPLLELFDEFLQKDRVLQYTSVGIHKDDLLFEINEHSIKKYGSQGQQKSLLIALKLAQDRKSTRLNSSHVKISYAVSFLKKKYQF